MPNMEQAIRERAYHLWVADGCRDGHSDAYWLAAQRELLAASLGDVAHVTVSDAKVSVSPEKKSAPKAKAEVNKTTMNKTEPLATKASASASKAAPAKKKRRAA